MKAIDLYAGVGGWALGLELAGIEVVRSYEWWGAAADTHRNNLRGDVFQVDIRTMDFELLPEPGEVEIVVGSPPCTQFSYSNRGGNGDIADGLKDMYRFLEIVAYLKPKFWAFENVPRVKKVIDHELRDGGVLSKFSELFQDASVEVLDMSEFGVPQRRKRCVAGNFDFQLLKQYSARQKERSLGNVVEALQAKHDPIYGLLSPEELIDDEHEAFLDWEEVRFNRDMKVAHPVYNGMPFPEPMDRPARTVTATCTRVSRESLVVEDTELGGFRRLSVRERASLQGFPVTFQFHGKSHAEKLKMIGNAIPPAFTYFIGNALSETKADDVKPLAKVCLDGIILPSIPKNTKPETPGRSYPDDRRFRFAIPSLRFKSGMRFELANVRGPDDWKVEFFFGDSKRIHSHLFSDSEIEQVFGKLSERDRASAVLLCEKVSILASSLSSETLQKTWSRKMDGIHPFQIVDRLDELVSSVIDSEFLSQEEYLQLATEWLFDVLSLAGQRAVVGAPKLLKNVRQIMLGAIICAAFNSGLEGRGRKRLAA